MLRRRDTLHSAGGMADAFAVAVNAVILRSALRPLLSRPLLAVQPEAASAGGAALTAKGMHAAS